MNISNYEIVLNGSNEIMKSNLNNYKGSLADLFYQSGGEDNLCFVSGQKPKLAFGPSDTLKQTWQDIDLAKIKRFCAKHQAKKNLIIGIFSYDLGLYLHGINPKNKSGLPLAHLYAFENYLEEDDGIKITHKDPGYAAYVRDIASKPLKTGGEITLKKPFRPKWNKTGYRKAFSKAKEYIKDGDIYQINLSYPMFAKSNSAPADIFNRLLDKNRAVRAGFFDADDHQIISMSPETFININGRKILTFPIKGTRRRSPNVGDKAVIKQLLSDKKELAELNMITDLLRNDLSIVCRPDSVKIKSKRKIAKLARVIHTYSHIAGELSPEVSTIDALLKMFPGGSISGCPKKRAIEIIDELEDSARGTYTGSLFSLEPNGNLEANLLIRTIIKRGSELTLPVGGGIVYDSNSENEYQETIDKSLSITSAFANNYK